MVTNLARTLEAIVQGRVSAGVEQVADKALEASPEDLLDIEDRNEDIQTDTQPVRTRRKSRP